MKTTKIIAFLLHFAACVLFAFSSLIDIPLECATTAVAAIRTGRNWIGYEMNTEFYNRALKRIDETMRTPTLF